MAKNIPENWEPPYPSWSADLTSDDDHIVISYYGVQYREGNKTPAEVRKFYQQFDAARGLEFAPLNVERGQVIDAKDDRNDMIVCYWPNRKLFQRWQEQSSFSRWLQEEDREQGEVGFWLEQHIIPLTKIETLFSSTNPVGAAALSADEMTGPIKEHAYWGGMRDRIPSSEYDRFEGHLRGDKGDLGPVSERRIIMQAPENLCIIRSGQNWTYCQDEERETYLNLVHPVLQEGMTYLRDNPIESGCLSCRFVTETDQNFDEVQRSFGFAYFTSMQHLEEWAKSHPTHIKIFANFHQLVEKFNFELDLRLWHEVAILSKENSHFEYINCHSDTGILGKA